MLQVAYVFLASDFNSPGSLAHIHFTTFTLNAVHPNVLMPRLSLIGLSMLEIMGTELVQNIKKTSNLDVDVCLRKFH